ncbi:MAG: PTS fructose transporter subunit IIA [Solobacterium sp.]|nr:PTS fructose transporter subunit IIA [Solobacterium sp.]
MTGLIITGHGRFAEGMLSALELIAGPQNDCIAVNFEHEVGELETDLQNALDSLYGCGAVIIFCDLPGGSPFKTAAVLTQDRPDTAVIAGVNMPMLCEIALTRTFQDDLSFLRDSALRTGREQIIHLDREKLMQDEEEVTEGI